MNEIAQINGMGREHKLIVDDNGKGAEAGANVIKNLIK